MLKKGNISKHVEELKDNLIDIFEEANLLEDNKSDKELISLRNWKILDKKP